MMPFFRDSSHDDQLVDRRSLPGAIPSATDNKDLFNPQAFVKIRGKAVFLDAMRAARVGCNYPFLFTWSSATAASFAPSSGNPRAIASMAGVDLSAEIVRASAPRAISNSHNGP